MRVLAVCLGNICRSPTAEAALREAAAERGISIEVDSAGTAGYHIGRPPDGRMIQAAAAEGLALGGTARQVQTDDFLRFDVILAMDRSNLADLQALAPCPELSSKLHLFRDFEGEGEDPDVPDPYYGEAEGFGEVVAICLRASAGFVERVASDAGLNRPRIKRSGVLPWDSSAPLGSQGTNRRSLRSPAQPPNHR